MDASKDDRGEPKGWRSACLTIDAWAILKKAQEQPRRMRSPSGQLARRLVDAEGWDFAANKRSNPSPCGPNCDLHVASANGGAMKYRPYTDSYCVRFIRSRLKLKVWQHNNVGSFSKSCVCCQGVWLAGQCCRLNSHHQRSQNHGTTP